MAGKYKLRFTYYPAIFKKPSRNRRQPQGQVFVHRHKFLFHLMLNVRPSLVSVLKTVVRKFLKETQKLINVSLRCFNWLENMYYLLKDLQCILFKMVNFQNICYNNIKFYIVLLWFYVACFWCQSFGDVSTYVCSYYF